MFASGTEVVHLANEGVHATWLRTKRISDCSLAR
jgi:hypothetical protein